MVSVGTGHLHEGSRGGGNRLEHVLRAHRVARLFVRHCLEPLPQLRVELGNLLKVGARQHLTSAGRMVVGVTLGVTIGVTIGILIGATSGVTIGVAVNEGQDPPDA